MEAAMTRKKRLVLALSLYVTSGVTLVLASLTSENGATFVVICIITLYAGAFTWPPGAIINN
jgi:hypothetical protein